MFKYPAKYYQDRDRLLRHTVLMERHAYAVKRHAQAFKMRMRALKAGRLNAAILHSEKQSLWFSEMVWTRKAIGGVHDIPA